MKKTIEEILKRAREWKGRFHPPDYNPTEQETTTAYLRFCLEGVLYDAVLGVVMGYRKERDRDISAQDLKYLDGWYKKWEDDGEIKDLWEYMFSYDEFKKGFTNALQSEHNGDCVKACTKCFRCDAEKLYKLPSTVIWCHNHLLKDCKECPPK